MKQKIVELIHLVMKPIAPVLKNLNKCAFPHGEHLKRKTMHVIGLDILFDSECNPWLLELNVNPSPVISFDPKGYLDQKGAPEPPISPIDLDAKVAAWEDAVEICMMPKEKILEIDHYKTYTKVYDPQIEKGYLSDFMILDQFLEIYDHIVGSGVCYSLNKAQFRRTLPLFSSFASLNVTEETLDQAHDQIVSFYEKMNFQNFFIAFDLILKPAYDPEDEYSRLKLHQKVIEEFARLRDQI